MCSTASSADSLTCVLAAVAVAFTWAGAAAPAWPAAQGRATGIRPAGAGTPQPSGRPGRLARGAGAIEVPGLGALNKGGNAGVLSVSCASAGNCAAGGVYRDRRGHQQGFVASQRHGRWGTAIEVPGLGNAGVLSVSCASAGNCAAAGTTGWTAAVTCRGSWPASARPLGHGDRGCPAWGP